MRKLPVLQDRESNAHKVAAVRAQPPVVADGAVSLLGRLFAFADRALRHVPSHLNPMAQLGAVANVTFIIAIVTGVLLLFWYTPSLGGAYESLAVLGDASLGQLMRSLHRYSSDACILVVFIHALRAIAARQVGGARVLPWITGILLLGFLWFVGWTGYWLVWDERAQLVATGSSKLLDVLPIFVDPLSRSFLTDGSVNSLFFFVVFFVHMLLPMAMGIALWLHIVRLNRSRFLTGLDMSFVILIALVVVSLIFPATSAGKADMTAPPTDLTMDWWYLAPLYITDRLGGGALWAVVWLAGIISMSAPWWFVRKARWGKRRARPAEVDVAKCNSCRKCFTDCPYGAISMVPRSDGKDFEAQAEVDPDLCVGCGICAGSCDSSGVALPWLPAPALRKTLDQFLDAAEEPAPVVFVCAESAAAGISVDPDSGVCAELGGAIVMPISCAGWVHPLSVERAFRHGASRVVIAGCRDCIYREGAKWAQERLEGKREPSLRTDKVDPALVDFVAVDGRGGLEAHLAGEGGRSSSRLWGIAGGIGAVLVICLLSYLPSDLGYSPPQRPEAELVVSFRHPGKASEICRERSAAELAEMPAHMRQAKVCERKRASVRLRVRLDGDIVHEQTYEPGGLFSDGTSVAIESFSMRPGKHRVQIEIGDTPDAGEWPYVADKTVEFARDRRTVVLFDKLEGFSWH
jgi:ferredoxin